MMPYGDPYIWANIGSGYALSPDAMEPLPDPILTYHTGPKEYIHIVLFG